MFYFIFGAFIYLANKANNFHKGQLLFNNSGKVKVQGRANKYYRESFVKGIAKNSYYIIIYIKYYKFVLKVIIITIILYVLITIGLL